MAIDSAKATLAVKRRLACEMLKCWQQVPIFDSVTFGSALIIDNIDYTVCFTGTG